MQKAMAGRIAWMFGSLSAVTFASPPANFVLTSPDFGPGRPIPASHLFNDYGCTGGNRSPALEWHGAPKETQSFAITLFDLDEPGSPSGWWHWVVYNLPASASGLAENAGRANSESLPAGTVQGRTDMSQDAYHGPCPGRGEPAHRYQITIYALKVARLPVPAEASGAMVTFTARDYTLAKASLTARHGR
jgi:Raf kinase inhibitor-like YbhB/YbcL family protein